ncbi:MAG: TonB family protein [Longimicrobiales bacterium]
MAKDPARNTTPPAPKPAGQQQMFTNLIASKPKKDKGGPTAVMTSAVLHVILIALAIWASTTVKHVIAEDDPVAQLLTVQEEEPPPPPPPPPPPENEPPPVQAEVVDVPKGFQTLAPPTIVPPDIPPPSTGAVINERDFSGEGVVGGRSTGKVTTVTAENIEAAPVFTPYTVRPALQNGDAVSRALQRYYPPLLRDAGIGGTVNLWFFIDETGKVVKTQLKVSSGHAALDDAAEKVASLMVFSPALNRDQKVKVWVDMPIVFKSQ